MPTRLLLFTIHTAKLTTAINSTTMKKGYIALPASVLMLPLYSINKNRQIVMMARGFRWA